MTVFVHANPANAKSDGYSCYTLLTTALYYTLSPSSPRIRIMASSSPSRRLMGSSPDPVSLYRFSSVNGGRAGGGGGAAFAPSDVKVTTLMTVKTMAARIAVDGKVLDDDR